MTEVAKNENSGEKKVEVPKISVVRRAQRLVCEHLDWSVDKVRVQLEAEGLSCKANTLAMTCRNVHLIVSELKDLGLFPK